MEQYEPTTNQPHSDCCSTDPDCLRLIVRGRRKWSKIGHHSKRRKRKCKSVGQHKLRCLPLPRHEVVREHKERSIHDPTGSSSERVSAGLRRCVWIAIMN